MCCSLCTLAQKPPNAVLEILVELLGYANEREYEMESMTYSWIYVKLRQYAVFSQDLLVD